MMRASSAALACLTSTLSLACGGGGAGQLDRDAGDVVPDGSAVDAAGAQAFDQPGPAATTTAEVTITLPGDRSIAATVCTATSGTPRPLVILSPGFAMGLDQYASYCTHLASWGYPTVLAEHDGIIPDHSQSADDRAAIIDWASTAPEITTWDGTHVAVAGHSLGGKVSILAALRDARIGLVVGWDPVDAGNPSIAPEQVGDLAAPLVLLGETLDGVAGPGIGAQACAPSADNFAQYYDGAPGPVVELTVVGADHMDWVDDGSCFACGFCQDGAADREVVRALTRRTTVAALRYYLEQDAAAATWLTGDGVAADVAAGRLTQRAK